jgi:hypothetical protein
MSSLAGLSHGDLIRKTLVFCLFWGGASVLQFRAHAFQSEFGSDPDEPAHYVTGLMVRDYALSGFSKRPLEYARYYYVHYPKVALGHWPPFFYLVQAVWTLAFAPSRTAVMLLMGAITALLATLLCETVRQEMFFGFGAGVSALFVSLPVVERFGSTVMSRPQPFCRVYKQDARSDDSAPCSARQPRKIQLAVRVNPSDECDDRQGVVNSP